MSNNRHSSPNSSSQYVNLQSAAHQVMLDNGFQPDFGPDVQKQIAEITSKSAPVQPSSSQTRDLRKLLWSSIDNDTSKDLDQIEVAEKLPNGDIKVLIGIADVDAFVAKGTPIDAHAASQTTSVYTGVRIFPMLPEELSNNITSLVENADKFCNVIEFFVGADGEVKQSSVYPALVRNQAQLAYPSVGAWLEERGDMPPKVSASPELEAQLKLQDQAAQLLRKARFSHGALDIETIEVRPNVVDGHIQDLQKTEKNRATELIEDFMVAANGVTARLFETKRVSSIRRVVKTPKRWERIVELAAQSGWKLPQQPDSKSLNDFLTKRKSDDPDHFADLSLAVIKLMGPGEYVLERRGDPEIGHFGLAVQDYTHSTAPNRRFADLVTQRIIKALAHEQPSPYSDGDLSQIAQNCTLKEDAARKVERAMQKRIAAVVMSHRIGEIFNAIVTGVTPKGTFVRVVQPHVEGLLASGAKGLDVGDKLQVKLTRTDVQHGFIDFARVH